MNAADFRAWRHSPDDSLSLGRRCLHLYAVLTTVSILVLICSGGLVTSKEAGLTVPDWPTSYGYNMFAFPFSRWVGGVLYEHTHRLLASGVGFLTLVLMFWLLCAEPRRWVRWLGVAASIAVIIQGVLGGLRVIWLAAYIGIFHALLAQAFLSLVAVIALVTSPYWIRTQRRPDEPWLPPKARHLALMVVGTTAWIYLQLALGATMRHAHAGLSIPDFPTVYGRWWPPRAAELAKINAGRDALGMPPATLSQIHLQWTHRWFALLICLGVFACAAAAWRKRAILPSAVLRLALVWPLMIAGQMTLGMYTIWTNKAADVATAHVAVGAASLVWGVLLCCLIWRDADANAFAARSRSARSRMEVPA